MRKPLRVLLVEDCEDDIELVVIELRRGGYEPSWERVETERALRAVLTGREWDLIICDYVLPAFSGPAALRVIREAGSDAAVIMVSGEVGEEIAVAAMRAGAHDFVSKHRLARLVGAVERELQAREVRRARRSAEASLRFSEERLRTFFNEATDLIFTLDTDGCATSVNETVCRVTGYSSDELLGRSPLDLVIPEDREVSAAKLATVLAGGGVDSAEFRIRARDGRQVTLEVRGRSIRDDNGRVVATFHIARDVTERRREERRLGTVYGVNRTLTDGAYAIERWMPRLLETIGAGTHWEVGEAWLAVAPPGTQRWWGLWNKPSFDVTVFEGLSRDVRCDPGSGMPGRVWTERRPLWVADLGADPLSLLRPLRERVGVRSLFAFPILDAAAVFGTMAFFASEPRPADAALLEAGAVLGQVIGRFFAIDPQAVAGKATK